MTTHETMISSPNEKLIQQQEISDLKLQLNASQQRIASLELKVRQKEETIIKSQADLLKTSESFENEITSLKEQLLEKSEILENSSTTKLQEDVRVAEEKAAKALNDLQDQIKKELKMNQILEEYERTIANHTSEYRKLNDLHEAVKGNLATLEMAFHDVIQKYERAKSVIEGFKANEDVFKENFEIMGKNLKVESQRYESLKAHAMTQIEKANKENALLKSQYESLDNKRNAIIKRLEIKAASLENALEQKNRECMELSALCDEVTGKKV